MSTHLPSVFAAFTFVVVARAFPVDQLEISQQEFDDFNNVSRPVDYKEQLATQWILPKLRVRQRTVNGLRRCCVASMSERCQIFFNASAHAIEVRSLTLCVFQPSPIPRASRWACMQSAATCNQATIHSLRYRTPTREVRATGHAMGAHGQVQPSDVSLSAQIPDQVVDNSCDHTITGAHCIEGGVVLPHLFAANGNRTTRLGSLLPHLHR